MSATLNSFLDSGRAVGKVVKNHTLPGQEFEVVEATPERILPRRLPAKGPKEIDIDRQAAIYWTEVE